MNNGDMLFVYPPLVCPLREYHRDNLPEGPELLGFQSVRWISMATDNGPAVCAVVVHNGWMRFFCRPYRRLFVEAILGFAIV